MRAISYLKSDLCSMRKLLRGTKINFKIFFLTYFELNYTVLDHDVMNYARMYWKELRVGPATMQSPYCGTVLQP